MKRAKELRPKSRGVLNHRDVVLAAVDDEPETLQAIAARAGVCRKTAMTWLAALMQAGLVLAVGPSQGGHWRARRYQRRAAEASA
ncbi:MAG TPA: hypothetical protein VF491_17660 [Vicinamibacterales bacterium]